jgi:hypothetical protein
MQINKIWSILGNTTLLTCSVLCLVIFIFFPGAISQAQEATLYDISMLPEKVSKILIATYLSDTLASLFGMVFFGASCISLGASLTSIFHLDEVIEKRISLPRGILLPTYFLIGNAAFSLILLALASLSYLSTTLSFLILSAGLLSGLAQFRKLPKPTIRFTSRSEKIVVFLSATILGVSLFQSSAHLSYDASAVYFSIAKLTALERHVGYYMENSFPVSVFHSVIPSSAVMQIFGDQSARMIAWLFGVVNIALAAALAERVGVSTFAQRILPSLVLTSTAFLDLMGDGKVDLFSSAYSLAAVYWMMANVQKPNQSQVPYLLSGCFIGFACILRPYNAFLLGVFVFIHTIQKLKMERLPFLRVVWHIGWMVLGAAGFAVYHILFNKIILGSPFAFWTSVVNINPVEGPWDFKAETIWTYRLLYPIIVTFKNSGASLGNITPLALVFLSTMAIPGIRKRVIFQKDTVQLAISACVTLFLWVFLFFTVIEVRYVLFLWIILFILIAEIAAKTFEMENSLLGNAVAWCTVLLMSFILVRSIYISLSTYSPVDSRGNPQCSNSDVCGYIAEINETASPNERVLTLSAYRYYLRTDLFACSTMNVEYKIFQGLTAGSIEEFWLEVYRQGYKYIAFENGYTREHIRLKIIPSPDNTPSWIELEPIFGRPGDWEIAYKINVTDPPIMMTSICRQNNNSGIWEIQSVIP